MDRLQANLVHVTLYRLQANIVYNTLHRLGNCHLDEIVFVWMETFVDYIHQFHLDSMYAS